MPLSDSDDDDFLSNLGPALSRTQKRAAEKSRCNAISYLDDAMEGLQERRVMQERLERIKQEEHVEEEVLVKAESLANTVANVSRSERRRETNDVIEGISSSETNATVNDGGMDRDRLQALSHATTTGRTTLLGTRQTMGNTMSETQGKCSGSVLWHSEKDATRELKKCLTRMDAQHRSNPGLRAAVTKPLRTALTDKILPEFLCMNLIVKHCEKHKVKDVPEDLMTWLYRLACSGGTDQLPHALCTFAFENILALWDNNISSKEPFLALADLEPKLKEWFGLCRESSSRPETSDEVVAEAKVHSNALGLKHFLHLWALAFLRGGVSFQKPEKGKRTTSQVITECVAALSRAGIDVTFHSGRRLLEPLRSILYALIKLVAEKHFCNDEAGWNQWMGVTVDRIVSQRSSFGPGTTEKEDSDDEEAWLCLSLMTRLFPNHDTKGQIHEKSSEFKAQLAMQSLQTCLEIKDWDKHVREVLEENGSGLEERYDTSLRWKAISSAYVAFLTIELLGDKVAEDGPRCMATFESTMYCAQAGMNLFSLLSPSEYGSGGRYGTSDEADAVYHAMELLENQGNQLIKRIKPYSKVRPHFRRVEHHLTCLRGYYRFCKEEASSMAGHTGPSIRTQKTMNNFFNGHDSDDEDGDGYGD